MIENFDHRHATEGYMVIRGNNQCTGSKNHSGEQNCSKPKVICKFNVSWEKNRSWLFFTEGKMYKQLYKNVLYNILDST